MAPISLSLQQRILNLEYLLDLSAPDSTNAERLDAVMVTLFGDNSCIRNFQTFEHRLKWCEENLAGSAALVASYVATVVAHRAATECC